MEDVTVHCYVGIDIAKETFDACALKNGDRKGPVKQFKNNADGHAKLLRWVAHYAPGLTPWFCMEATGTFYEALAKCVADRGHTVSVVNPRNAHYASAARGAVNRTDPSEAFNLADHCRRDNPPIWIQCRPEVRALTAIARRHEALVVMLTSEKNRLSNPGVENQGDVHASIARHISYLEDEIKRLLQEAEDHIDQHPDIKRDRDLLLTIPGLGKVTSMFILAEIPNIKEIRSARSAAAFVGLAPRIHESGTSVRRTTRISKCGSSHLRRVLFMPSMSAMRVNPPVKALCDRLIERGHSRKSALIAAMRKLIMIAYGVLKSQKEFEYNLEQT